MKVCSTCHISKPESEFIKNSQSKDGLKGSCKDCTRAYDIAWYAATAEKRKAWAIANPEKAAAKTARKNAQTQRWKLAHPEKCRESSKTWRINNIYQLLENNARHQAKKLKATPGWANTEFEKFAIKEMYALAKLRTKILGTNYHVDHIVPLNSPMVQGFHCLANLQILEAKTNISKSNKIWPDMPID